MNRLEEFNNDQLFTNYNYEIHWWKQVSLHLLHPISSESVFVIDFGTHMSGIKGGQNYCKGWAKRTFCWAKSLDLKNVVDGRS